MRVLGLDCGIASVGWSLIEMPDVLQPEDFSSAIIAAGTWMFDPPEEKSQTGTKLKSAARRVFRGQRRIIKRRRKRMNDIRELFASKGLLVDAAKDRLAAPGLDPWDLRVRGLDQALTPLEFAVALGHIARHRGFKSNKKGAGSNAPDEDGKMLVEVARTQEKLTRHGTAARLFQEDETFVLRRTLRKDGSLETVRRFRNREGDYSRSLLRDDLHAEVRQIFQAQRRFGMAFASDNLETAFTKVAFFQRPLQDSETMVGSCPFVETEKRAARRSPSFELFRYLSRLNTLTIMKGRDGRRLGVEEIGKAVSDFGVTQGISYASLRKKLGLSADETFEGVKAAEEGKKDVVARSGEAAPGTAKLRKLISGQAGEMAWLSLQQRPEILDAIAQVISFRDDMDRIALGLGEINLDPTIRELLTSAAAAGEFDKFTGAGHISAKAARAIIPGLLQGLTYDKACALANFDHTASRERHAFDVRDADGKPLAGKQALGRILKDERVSRDMVGSPTARKALIEALKQVKAIIEEYGLPDRIHVEMARDVGKSIEERGEIERGIEKRNKQKDKLRLAFSEKIGRPVSEGSRGIDELMRFELWEQQNCRCLYTDDYISPHQLFDDDNTVQIDHILPWGRFGDDSFHNKTLCTAQANQDKRGRTPFEWFRESKTEADWTAFTARVQAIPYMKGLKRRNYLLRNAAEVQERFRNSNLNDTRWTCRLLAEALRQVLPDIRDEKGDLRRRVFVRPGALTDRLRRAWGLQWIKKDEDGKRIPDDRHHALDATIVAAATESLLNRATREIQKIEDKGLHYDLTKAVDEPWRGFRQQVIDAVDKVFVARAERRRARGKAHDATIRQIAERDGKDVVYERKAVEKLVLADLDRIKDPDRNAALVESLRDWINAGKPNEAELLPKSPKGDPIGKVRLESKAKVNVQLFRGGHNNPPGTVDRGDMAGVDVFRKATNKGIWQFYVVPVYPHEIATLDSPPNRAVTANKPGEEWPVVDATYEFLWSLVPMSYLELVSAKGEVFEGYYRGMDRSVGAIQLSPHENSIQLVRGIGVRTLNSFQKFTVDRLGRKFEIERETRTWRGKVCI